jgi:hypothetical protein
MSEDSHSPGTLTRRDTLKLIGSAFGGVAIVPMVETAIKPESIQKEKNDLPQPTFETPIAYYYANYERHDRPIDVKEEMSSKPHVLLIEGAINPKFSETFSDGSVILMTDNFGRRMIPDTEIGLMMSNNCRLATENVAIPDAVDKSEDLSKIATPIAVSALDLVSVGNLLLKLNQKKAGLKDVGAVAITSLLTILTGTSAVAREASLIAHDPALNDNKKLEVLTERINAALNLSGKKDFGIFFRSVLFARKLITLAENQKDKLEEKPRISYRIGVGHAEVQDIVQMGDESLSLLDAFTDSAVKGFVDFNGGVDRVVTSRLISVEE